jgi:hypothetical protein
MVRLMRMIPPWVSTEVSSLLYGSIGTQGTSDTDGVIAAFRLFHTQRKASFTLSPNTKKFVLYFHYICVAIFMTSGKKMLVACAQKGSLQFALHAAGIPRRHHRCLLPN